VRGVCDVNLHPFMLGRTETSRHACLLASVMLRMIVVMSLVWLHGRLRRNEVVVVGIWVRVFVSG
jgi:hypothetical protein